MLQLIAQCCCCVAYNGVLGMTAMPDEASSVLLTKYAREDAMDACEVSCIAMDHLSLYPAETVSAQSGRQNRSDWIDLRLHTSELNDASTVSDRCMVDCSIRAAAARHRVCEPLGDPRC